MCGFSGIISRTGHKLSLDDFIWHEQITQSLSHRGPDFTGFKKKSWYTLSHNRLSIVDLDEKANQPFEVDNSDLILLFNGEIYNFRKLRKHLETNYKFKTSHSDTEVLFYMWREYGIKMFDFLDGFYAGVILEKKTKKVFLFRDKSGKKPLFYSLQNSKLIFSSEASSIRSGKYKSNFPISKESISHFLTYLAPPSGKSMFENIEKLRPGEVIEINANEIESKIISSLIKDVKFPLLSRPEFGFLEKSKQLVIESLGKRLDVDVPVWFALSGGLDSSLNVLNASKQLNLNKINTITISNSKSKYSEHNNASKLAKIIKSNHKLIDITESEFLSEINEYLNFKLDLPVGDMSGVLMYIMTKEVKKQGGKVLIVGEGGDELGGYNSYKKEFVLHLIKKLNLQMLLKRVKRYESKKGYILPIRNQHGFTIEEKINLLKFKFKDDRDLMFKNLKAMSQINNHIKLLMANEYLYRIPEVIHSRIDLPSMRNGVEVRAPFLDFDLIKLFGNKSWALKLMPKPKKHFRKLISQFKEADFLLKERKIGFGMLTDTFIESITIKSISKWIESDHPLLEFLNKDELKSRISEEQRKMSKYKLWIIYSLGRWIENAK